MTDRMSKQVGSLNGKESRFEQKNVEKYSDSNFYYKATKNNYVAI